MNKKSIKENCDPCKSTLKSIKKKSAPKSKVARQKLAIIDNIVNERDKQSKPTKAQKKNKSLIQIPNVNNHKLNNEIAPRDPYCFGFSDDDFDQEIPPYNGELTSFDNSKPYRLALYVKPSNRVKVDLKTIQQIQNWSTMDLKNVTLNATAVVKRKPPPAFKSPQKTQWKLPYATSTPKVCQKKEHGADPVKHINNLDNKKELAREKVINQQQINDTTKMEMSRITKIKPVKAKPMIQKKITEILLPSPKRTRSGNCKQQFQSFFESPNSTEEEVESPKPAAKRTRKQKAQETVVEQEQDETSSDDAIQPVFQVPSRRSYVKKSRRENRDAYDGDETPTEEILKSMEKSKRKVKNKKIAQDEADFEKWSQSMNSVFSEVEQFELSFEHQ